MAADTKSEQTFQVSTPKQMLVLVRYKPADAMAADDMLGGATSAVEGAVGAVENMASSIPGVDLFFKEEKEPEKKSDKEYNYYKDYKEWDEYFKKMDSELPEKLKEEDDQTLVFDFDVSEAGKREQEGKKLFNQIKGKISGWKNYEAHFHFVGLGQGGNVANECIKELIKEEDFKRNWCVKSTIYIGTPFYKTLHQFDERKAFNSKGQKISFANSFDLTHRVVEYFEPKDKLLKLIAESNSNTVSVFTGKIKAQLVATLGRLLSIKSFGTGSDNEGNIDKLTQCKDDVSNLVNELKEACLPLFDALPQLIDPGELPEFKKLADGFDQVPDKCVERLENFIDELKKAKESAGFDSKNIGINKLFNVFCPLVDQVTNMLKVFTYNEKSQETAMDKVFEKAGIKKILARGEMAATIIPADPYFEKVAEMAQEADKRAKQAAEKAKADGENGRTSDSKTKEQVLYDQAALIINTAANNLDAVTPEKDLEIKDATFEQKQKIFEAITVMLLPMMPSKKKFYGRLLDFLPLGGLNGFLSNLTADKAMAPLKTVMGYVGADDFDEGTSDQPGLKISIRNLNAELNRIKGFLNKNNYPIHKDANSLYFIYNSHNIMLKKPYGRILNSIDRQTGYYDAMVSSGYDNSFDLNKNRYTGKGGQTDNAQPVVMVAEEASQ